MTVTRPRIALYGHDTFGLGHVRRNLALAAALSKLDPQPDILILSGAAESLAFPLPPGTEVIVMPSITKDGHGEYGARRLSVGLEGVLALRSGVLTAALEQFDPDLFVVDKVPLGLGGELEPAVRTLVGRGRVRIVLGLRDVLDEPAVAREEWRVGGMTQAVRAYFDEVWIYGDPSVHDLADVCGMPPGLRDQVRYTGFLAHTSVSTARPPMVPAGRPYVLGMVGGGQDGADLATAFARTAMPAGTTGLLLTGPHMTPADQAAVAAVAVGRDDLVVEWFTPNASTWIDQAAAIVTMGGYNTVTELLGSSVPGLVVPRMSPRAEQVVRAEALSALGLFDWLPPAEAVPARLGQWLADAVTRGPADRSGVALDGLAIVGRLAAAQLAAPRAAHSRPGALGRRRGEDRDVAV